MKARKARTIITGLIVSALLALGIITTTGGPASATIIGNCGTGYGLIDTYTITTVPDDAALHGTPVGYIHLYYSNTTHKNCAVQDSAGSPWYGWPQQMSISIRLSGGTWSTDAGEYHYFAGPVYTPVSSGHCIDVTASGGANGYSGVQKYNVHCG